ncbi:unnamed protein product [Paramecium pentaurelia]|uniref:Uncharacterized protein n=1 Tax=Paramecium pentaurelia TaxID=43138 RepID=A0A8S1VRV6_9CILI|nr:unnamed protein product [Paramecium pentaurelia]
MQQINLFTKPKVETKKTTCGGILALFTLFSVGFLIIGEIIRSFQLEVLSMIDTTNIDERIRVNLNITIHDMTCFALSLDQQDITGTHLEDMEYTIHKLRMRDGKFINKDYAEKVKLFEQSLYQWNWYNTNEVNDCYGAQLFEGQKCITCQDVLLAYASRDWPLPRKENIEQCKYSYIQQNGRRMLFTEDFGEERRGQQYIDMNDLTAMAFTYGESCQIFGHFYVKRIPGNFHISFHGKGQAVSLISQDIQLSHTINWLEFTPQKQGPTFGRYFKTTNTLDGTTHSLEQKEDTQYYLKLVESHYETLFKETDLYTFTAYEQKLPTSERLTQIIFKYEFDPITTIYKSKISSWTQLIVAIFAVIGGVFSTSQFINSIFSRLGL